MKPMGGKKTLIENNCQDWRVKGDHYKKYKHSERQQAKRKILKEYAKTQPEDLFESIQTDDFKEEK